MWAEISRGLKKDKNEMSLLPRKYAELKCGLNSSEDVLGKTRNAIITPEIRWANMCAEISRGFEGQTPKYHYYSGNTLG